jgi:hypothetical protein
MRRDRDQGRTSAGLPVREAVALAACWWQDIGRQLANPELKDPDLGVPSGIMRGLPWDELTRDERLRVVKAWHDAHGKAAAAYEKALRERQRLLAEGGAGEFVVATLEPRAFLRARATGGVIPLQEGEGPETLRRVQVPQSVNATSCPPGMYLCGWCGVFPCVYFVLFHL